MAEFKKLSEVEQIETASDNATVLVEESGEIKRVPKKEVGGAGGYIATLTATDIDSPAVDGWSGGPVLSENYDEMYEVLCSGGSVWVDISAMINSTNSLVAAGLSPTNVGSFMCAVTAWTITDIGLMAMIAIEGRMLTCLFPNGSHNLEPGGK